MPIYEYQCASCQKVTETTQKFSDPPLTICPACGGALTKLISRTSFQLKGTGWYASDYKKSPASSAVTSSEKGGEKATSADASTDTPVAAPAKGSASGSGSSGDA